MTCHTVGISIWYIGSETYLQTHMVKTSQQFDQKTVYQKLLTAEVNLKVNQTMRNMLL